MAAQPFGYETGLHRGVHCALCVGFLSQATEIARTGRELFIVAQERFVDCDEPLHFAAFPHFSCEIYNLSARSILELTRGW